MDLRIPGWIMELNNITLLEKCLFAQISFYNNSNGCHASNAHLAKMFGVSEPTVMRAIGKLKALHYIEHAGYHGKYRRLITLVKKTSQIDTLVNTTRDTSQIDQCIVAPLSVNPSQIDQQKEDLKKEVKEDIILTPKQLERKEKNKELGRQAKACLDYYFQKHTEVRGFEPIIAGGRDMKLIKQILAADCSVGAFEEVTDFFFEYKKRSNFSTRALYNSFDTLYGVLLDKAEGRR